MKMEVPKLPKRFWDDNSWITKNYIELQKKYCEKWIAVVNRKVISVGNDPDSVRAKARQKTGVKYIPIAFVEGGMNIYKNFY